VINAPAADVKVSGGVTSMSGAVIGGTVSISGGSNLHYDEALSRIGGSGSIRYRVASWLEAVR
jgi:hypothetical protein